MTTNFFESQLQDILLDGIYHGLYLALHVLFFLGLIFAVVVMGAYIGSPLFVSIAAVLPPAGQESQTGQQAKNDAASATATPASKEAGNEKESETERLERQELRASKKEKEEAIEPLTAKVLGAMSAVFLTLFGNLYVMSAEGIDLAVMDERLTAVKVKEFLVKGAIAAMVVLAAMSVTAVVLVRVFMR